MVDTTETLWLGDTLQVTLDNNTVIHSVEDFKGLKMPLKYKALLESTRNKLANAGYIEIGNKKEEYVFGTQKYYEPLRIYWLRPQEDEEWTYSLYEMLYEEKNQVQTRFETINEIDWRICLHGMYADCFCEEEPYLMFRMKVGENIGNGPLPEDFYIMMKEIHKPRFEE